VAATSRLRKHVVSGTGLDQAVYTLDAVTLRSDEEILLLIANGLVIGKRQVHHRCATSLPALANELTRVFALAARYLRDPLVDFSKEELVVPDPSFIHAYQRLRRA
jgi:hypothetical protein